MSDKADLVQKYTQRYADNGDSSLSKLDRAANALFLQQICEDWEVLSKYELDEGQIGINYDVWLSNGQKPVGMLLGETDKIYIGLDINREYSDINQANNTNILPRKFIDLNYADHWYKKIHSGEYELSAEQKEQVKEFIESSGYIPEPDHIDDIRDEKIGKTYGEIVKDIQKLKEKNNGGHKLVSDKIALLEQTKKAMETKYSDKFDNYKKYEKQQAYIEECKNDTKNFLKNLKTDIADYKEYKNAETDLNDKINKGNDLRNSINMNKRKNEAIEKFIKDKEKQIKNLDSVFLENNAVNIVNIGNDDGETLNQKFNHDAKASKTLVKQNELKVEIDNLIKQKRDNEKKIKEDTTELNNLNVEIENLNQKMETYKKMHNEQTKFLKTIIAKEKQLDEPIRTNNPTKEEKLNAENIINRYKQKEQHIMFQAKKAKEEKQEQKLKMEKKLKLKEEAKIKNNKKQQNIKSNQKKNEENVNIGNDSISSVDKAENSSFISDGDSIKKETNQKEINTLKKNLNEENVETDVSINVKNNNQQQFDLNTLYQTLNNTLNTLNQSFQYQNPYPMAMSICQPYPRQYDNIMPRMYPSYQPYGDRIEYIQQPEVQFNYGYGARTMPPMMQQRRQYAPNPYNLYNQRLNYSYQRPMMNDGMIRQSYANRYAPLNLPNMYNSRLQMSNVYAMAPSQYQQRQMNYNTPRYTGNQRNNGSQIGFGGGW